MKAERRHELQHNELADWVGEAIERIKPYSRAIVGVVVAAAVLLVTYVVLSGRAERKQSNAWTDYYLALQGPLDSVESDLEAVMREHEGEAAGLWAEVALADMKLGEGIRALFTDKAAAKKDLATAVEHYEAVIPEAEDPLLIARARFGLARALESQGELKRAREVYEQIVEASGTNAYVSLAKDRLNDLKRDETQDFYAWFEQQEPVSVPPADSSLLPGTPGEKLPFDASLLDTPGGVNLSGKNLLDIPELEKGTGPLLSPPTKSDAADDESGKETPDSGATKESPESGKKNAGKEKDEIEKADVKPEVKDAGTPNKDQSPPESKTSEADESKAVADDEAKSDSANEESSGDKTP